MKKVFRLCYSIYSKEIVPNEKVPQRTIIIIGIDVNVSICVRLTKIRFNVVRDILANKAKGMNIL